MFGLWMSMPSPAKVLTAHEREKKKKSLEACLEQRRHFFPGFVVSTDGLLDKATIILLKKLSAFCSHRNGRNPSPNFFRICLCSYEHRHRSELLISVSVFRRAKCAHASRCGETKQVSASSVTSSATLTTDSLAHLEQSLVSDILHEYFVNLNSS
jgi:hypothetical protein